jgi:hypothetical protein
MLCFGLLRDSRGGMSRAMASTRDDRILLKVQKVVVILLWLGIHFLLLQNSSTTNYISLILVFIFIIGNSINIVIHKALSLEEVLPPLFLLDLLLTLIQLSLLLPLKLHNVPFLQLLQQPQQL